METPDRRNKRRREADLLFDLRLRQHTRLLEMGQTLTSQLHLEDLFELIVEQTNTIMGCERSTVFLHDPDRDVLWSLVATDVKKKIEIRSDQGIAGWVFTRREPFFSNDVYGDHRFSPEVDEVSGFRTRNILCLPLTNREGDCIGVIQALNTVDGEFTGRDQEILTHVANYVAIALENSRLYEETRAYTEELRQTLSRIETLERVKTYLTKFVPSSVMKLAELDPDERAFEKIPMDVTILFIDIQGFSRLTEGYDQKLVNDMVELHFSAYLQEIEQQQGEVNETLGDGFMVIFKDREREENARAAVVAGLGIVAANKRLNRETPYPWGRIELHLGVGSGEAWVGSTKMKTRTGERWTYTASGLVTVKAARLGALSRDTQLYVGPETAEYVKDLCECVSMGAKEVRNVTEPIPVIWVKGLKAGKVSPAAEVAMGDTPGLSPA